MLACRHLVEDREIRAQRSAGLSASRARVKRTAATNAKGSATIFRSVPLAPLVGTCANGQFRVQ